MDGSTKPAARAPGKAQGKGADPITMGLQQLFKSVMDEPIPDEFLALLDQIDAAGAPKTPNTPGQGDPK